MRNELRDTGIAAAVIISVVSMLTLGNFGKPTQDANVHAEAEPTVQEDVQKNVQSTPKKQKVEKKVTWRDNPNNCNLTTQYVRADNFKCKDKPVKKAVPKPVVAEKTSYTAPQTHSGVGCDIVYNYTDWDANRAYRICKCESGGNPNAIGDQYPINGLYAPSVGLMQIRLLAGRPGQDWLMNPYNNVQYAHDMWAGQGFGPWTCNNKV